MTEERRKQLDKAWDMLEEAKEIVDNCKSDEEDAVWFIPKQLKDSEMAEQMEENVYIMEQVISDIQCSIDAIIEIVLSVNKGEER